MSYRKINKIICPIFCGLALSLNPIFCSCSKGSRDPEEHAYSIDGSDWPGMEETYGFLPEMYVIDEQNKTVTYNDGSNVKSNDHLTIPCYVNVNNEKYKVQLGEKCFQDNTLISGEIELNKFIVDIPKYCFASSKHVTNFTKIIFNSYPQIIEEGAFYQAINLTSLSVKVGRSFDDNIFKDIEEIGSRAFNKCDLSQQPNIIFGPNLKKLGNHTFAESRIQFVSFSYNKNINKIPSQSFELCSDLQSVDFNENITDISSNAFAGCLNLEKINLPKPNMVFTLGENAFAHCEKFTNFSQICYFDSFPKNCFLQCMSLDFLPWYWPPEVKAAPQIYQNAFEACDLPYVKFQKNLPQPEPKSFVGYKSMKRCSTGMVIDFTDYDVETPPDWKPVGNGPHELNGIFSDKPTFGVLRFKKDPEHQFLPEEWDDVLYSLGFDDDDFGENKWSIEFVEV